MGKHNSFCTGECVHQGRDRQSLRKSPTRSPGGRAFFGESVDDKEGREEIVEGRE